MNTNAPKPIVIFRPGSHISNKGHAVTFSESDVAATAAAYDPAKHNAPLVIGHPALDAPAYGWAKSLALAGGLLSMEPTDVDPQFAEWVNAKRYGTVSAAFYPPNSPSNPVPGVYYLRHVGFLGGHPPAIKGLPAPEFAAGDEFIVLEFSEGGIVSATEEEKAGLAQQKAALEKERLEFAEQQKTVDAEKAALAEREAKIAAAEQAAKKRELLEFAETQVKAGKLLPRDKAGAVELMAQLSDDAKLEFADGDEQKTVGTLVWFKGFLAGLPKSIEFGEMPDGGNQPALSDKQIADKTRAYHKQQTDAGVNLSFAEARDAVVAGLDKGA